MTMDNKVVNISKKTFLNVVILFSVLLVLSIVATYLIPRGMFSLIEGENGALVEDYNSYVALDGQSGINIFKGIFAPFLTLFSKDGLSIVMLMLFLLIVSGAFQIMQDTNGMKIIVNKLIEKFKNKKKLLISVIIFIFMCFGSFFGLFEEVLALLPLIIALSVSLGYDSFTGLLICVVATGFGFASAITNPFTVIPASMIIGVSPMYNVWYRIIVFLIMYALLLLYVFHHIKVISKDPGNSPTYNNDLAKRESLCHIESESNSKIFWVYSIFLLMVLMSIITVTSIESVRGYAIVFLIVIFLVGGIVSGYVVNNDLKSVFKSFLNGIIAAIPAIFLIMLSSSVKYVLDEGMVLPTIAHSISSFVGGKNIFLVAGLIYLIVLVLEFFVSSSTAKCILVMGVLSYVNVELSKEMLVLIYLFGDGYTNVLFPTSPVLLIGLSMVGMNYFTWLKKSKWLFFFNFVIVAVLIVVGILIGY